jgi:glycerophosphoryl diester phosphodiesterase
MNTRARSGFEIQGHRGARGLFPENTLEGFGATIALGVRVLELDIAVTADGVPVVFHDVALNPDIVRGADGTFVTPPGPPIVSLTLADLDAFDVGRLRPGSAYAAKYPEQTPHDGALIPTLKEVFSLTVPAGARVDAELKTLPGHPELTVPPDAMAAFVIAVAEAAGAMDFLDIRSFDWRGLRATRALRPNLPLTFLTNAKSAADRPLWWDCDWTGSVPAAIAAEAPGATWAPEFDTLTPDAIVEAHALGLRVVPWTVNDVADMARLREWGADGICTDRPDVALTWLASDD